MSYRLPIAALLAALVTFALFYTMQSLIARRTAGFEKGKSSFGVNFIRLAREETVHRKERQKPQKIEREKPPPPAAPSVADNSGGATMQAIKVDIPSFTGSFGKGGDGPMLAAGGNSDAVALVRVNPQYPSRARARGIEGWVHLRFTITPQGTTDDIEVVEAEPSGYFEAAAKTAVARYKYKPRVEGGTPVSRPGVEVLLTFELEK